MSDQDPLGIKRRGPIYVPPPSPPVQPKPPDASANPTYAAIVAAAADGSPLAAALVELHKPHAVITTCCSPPHLTWHCEGEEIGGYECDYADWPCGTVQIIAEHLGVEVPTA